MKNDGFCRWTFFGFQKTSGSSSSAESDVPVLVRIMDGKHELLQINMKQQTKFVSIRDALSARACVNVECFDLTYNGKKIADFDTPAKLNLKSGDFVHMVRT